MGINQYLPAMQITLNDIFIGGFSGFLLSLPISLFLAFWMSAMKNRGVVVLGASVGELLVFIIIPGWVDVVIFCASLPCANRVLTFVRLGFTVSVLGLV